MRAIALATEVGADVLLIDEQAGRQAALRRGLKVAGTLSVLDKADQAGLIVFDDVIGQLRKAPSGCLSRSFRDQAKANSLRRRTDRLTS